MALEGTIKWDTRPEQASLLRHCNLSDIFMNAQYAPANLWKHRRNLLKALQMRILSISHLSSTVDSLMQDMHWIQKPESFQKA